MDRRRFSFTNELKRCLNHSLTTGVQMESGTRGNDMRHCDNSRISWDAISAAYQQRRQLSTQIVNLGALVEDGLGARLLGDVQGKRILDTGCGGGQNAVALARLGAQMMGIDVSKAQIAYARTLAAAEGFEIPFAVCDAGTLGELADEKWDLVLSISVLHYLEDPVPAINEAARALLPGGRLVASVDHPIRALFWESDAEEWSLVPVREYHAQENDRSAIWRYPDTDVALTTWHHTVEEWVAMVQGAGLQLTALLEPSVPVDLLDELWPQDDALSPLRCIPHTLILVANKPLQ